MLTFSENQIDINKLDIASGTEASNHKVSELIRAMEPYAKDSRLFAAVDEIRIQMHMNTAIIQALYEKLQKQNFEVDEFYKKFQSI